MTHDDPPTSEAVESIELALRAACTDSCRLFHARRLVAAKQKRGDYAAILLAMSPEVAEALARLEVEKL